MKFGRSLRVFILVFLLVPIILFSIILQWRMEKQVYSALSDSLNTVSRMEITYINTFCDSERQALQIIAEDEDVVLLTESSANGLAVKPELCNKVNRELAKRKKNLSTIESISIVDRNFKNVASSEAYVYGETSTLAQSGQGIRRGDFSIGRVYTREINEEPTRVVAAYIGIFNEQGKLIGYIVQEINTSYFDQIREASAISQDSVICITDADQQIITSGTATEAVDYFDTLAKSEKNQEVIKLINSNKESAGSVQVEADGAKWLINYHTIEYTNWHIYVCCKTESYDEEIIASRNNLYSALIVVALIIVFSSYYFTDRITKPISDITATLTQVEKEQNYSLRIRSTKHDEMGNLSHRIDHLLDFVETADSIQKERQEILAERADRDGLTGIYNQKTTDLKVDAMLQEALKQDTKYALGFVDIDNFRNFNTEFGHQEGDNVIRFVADALKEAFGDCVGRNGGDEFLFWVSDAGDRSNFEIKIRELSSNLDQGYYSKGLQLQIHVPCSIGVVYDVPDERTTRKEVIRSADQAMYATKNRGKNGFTFFTD